MTKDDIILQYVCRYCGSVHSTRANCITCVKSCERAEKNGDVKVKVEFRTAHAGIFLDSELNEQVSYVHFSDWRDGYILNSDYSRVYTDISSIAGDAVDEPVTFADGQLPEAHMCQIKDHTKYSDDEVRALLRRDLKEATEELIEQFMANHEEDMH